MKFTLTMAMSLLFAPSVALADHHENQPNAAGGSIYFQTDDPAAYIALLKSDESKRTDICEAQTLFSPERS